MPERDRDDLAFIGQLYGERETKRSHPLQRELQRQVISQVFGRELSSAIRRHRIIIGPRYPSAPGYWSDRIYVVLGHGGFFLAPEIEGMRDEGFVPAYITLRSATMSSQMFATGSPGPSNVHGSPAKGRTWS